MSALPTKNTKSKPKFHDPTQQAEGKASRWVNEPLSERHPSLTVHTKRPFNAEPTNQALQQLYTPKGQHYRRTHGPVPLVDPNTYTLTILMENNDNFIHKFSLKDLQKLQNRLSYSDSNANNPHSSHSCSNSSSVKEVSCTMMCTGNRRSEYNPYGSTAGLPWVNGSISTAKWEGYLLRDILTKLCKIELPELAELPLSSLVLSSGYKYKFITFWGLDDFHISVPLSKVLDSSGDVILAYKMNGEVLPRDHGYPLRVIVPGYVGARCVKWLHKISLMKDEVSGPHQTGIAYKQLGPNYKKFGGIPTDLIQSIPPIDIIPVTSAITAPEWDQQVVVDRTRGKQEQDWLELKGYAYSGGGRAIIRVDISLDGGVTWDQADLIRVEGQVVRSNKAWAWCQWRYKVKKSDLLNCMVVVDSGGKHTINVCCKAIDDQYNQQPDSVKSIWNIRGILNTAWPRVTFNVKMINQARL